MNLKKGQVITLDIERLAYGGEGIGKHEGKVTFVPNVLPGDRVRVALTKIKSNRMEARAEAIVEPSPLRIEARCRHFDECGGCTWQNLSYADQLSFKEAQVRETLEHVGRFSPEECDRVMRRITGCAEPWAYRNKMEFSFGTKSREDQAPLLGLHVPGKRHDVFDVQECFLPSPFAVEVVEKMRAFARTEGLTVYHEGREEGLLRTLLIREGQRTGEWMVGLVTSEESFEAAERFATLFAGEPRVASLLHVIKTQCRGKRTSLETRVLAGAAVIHECLQLAGGRSLRFEIGVEAFFQPNTRQAEVLYGHVLALAGLSGDEVVYDLYCGTGTIGLFCAHACRAVVGIELNEQAVRNAERNAELNGLTNIRFVCGDAGKAAEGAAEDVKGAEHAGTGGAKMPRPDVVIVDPPRAGLEGDAPLTVASFKAPKLVYVSCNPATLARDLAVLTTRGYRLEAIQPVDMFPQTYHIETVALLSLTTEARPSNLPTEN